MFARVFRELMGREIERPSRASRITRRCRSTARTSRTCGTGWEFRDITDLAKQTEFKVFRGTAERAGKCAGSACPAGQTAAPGTGRPDGLRRDFRRQGPGLDARWRKRSNSPVAKFFTPEQQADLAPAPRRERRGHAFLYPTSSRWFWRALNELRPGSRAPARHDPEGRLQVLLGAGLPAPGVERQEKRWDARHHPFTSPREGRPADPSSPSPATSRPRRHDGS